MEKSKKNIFVTTKIKGKNEDKSALKAFLLFIPISFGFIFMYKFSAPILKAWWNSRPQELRSFLTLLPVVVIIFSLFIALIDSKWGHFSRQ